MSVRLAVALLALGTAARGEDAFEPPAPEAIVAAIDRGVAWLGKAQREDGSWGPCIGSGSYDGTYDGTRTCHDTGPTSFAIFVLATCGVPARDRGIQRGIEWLRAQERTDHRYTSYERASLVLMLAALNPPKEPPGGKLVRTKNPHTRPSRSPFSKKDWRWMHTCLDELLRNLGSDGGAGYWDNDEAYADVSATQFTVLALRAASFAGYPVEKGNGMLWQDIAKYHHGLQDDGGGFPYRPAELRSSGMTAAALSSLLICREQIGLLGLDAPEEIDASIENAFRSLGEQFDPARNLSRDPEHGGHYHYCHLYAVERSGVIGGRRELAGRDWYLRGARYLVDEQHEDGKWVDRTCMPPRDVLGTCFALLFLKKATMPAVTLAR